MKKGTELDQEIEDLEYMASGLTYEHQQSARMALLQKADNLKLIKQEEESRQ